MKNSKYYFLRAILFTVILFDKIFTFPLYASSASSSSTLTSDVFLRDQKSFNVFVSITAQKFYRNINDTDCIRLPIDGEARALPSTSCSELKYTLQPHAAGRIRMYEMHPKETVTPSTALKDLSIKHATSVILGCETIISIATLHCVLEALTPFVFDKYFSTGFSIGHTTLGNFLTICDGKNLPTERGEIGFITNIRSYFKRHPHRTASGDNVFCVGPNAQKEPLYIGIGALFKDGPKTLKQIRTEYKSEFLKDPTEKERATIAERKYFCPDYEVLKCSSDEVWEQYFSEAQATSGGVGVIDVNKVKAIKGKYANSK